MVTKKKASITRKQVLDYLASHPDFFNGSGSKTQEVLFNLRIPHEKPENTISLLEYQNNLWRERAEMAESGQKTILSDLQYNINVTKEMCRATLAIAESHDLNSLCMVLDKVFKEYFKLQAYKLVFFSKPPKSKLYSSWNKSSLPKELSSILDKKTLYAGELPMIVQDLFFGKATATGKGKVKDKAKNKDGDKDHDQLKSFACMPIYNSSKKRLIAVICLGSNVAERFSRDLLTDSISFLFDMIAVQLEQNLSNRKK